MTVYPLPTSVQAALRRARHPSENTLLLGLSVALGLSTGVGVWLFRRGIDLFTDLFQKKIAGEWLGAVIGPLGIVVTLAAVGALVGWMMNRFVGGGGRGGVAGVIEAEALTGGRLPYQKMPVRSLASALSLGAGAAVGPEAPSVVIGANLGSFFGQRLRLSEERVRLLVAAGSASAIAAAFRAPIAGVFFALEVILNGEFSTSSFGVVVLASVVSSVFIQAAEGGVPEMGALNYTLGSPLELIFFALLGLALAPLAVLYIRVVHWQHDLWDHHLRLSRVAKTALAGAIVGTVGMFLPQILGTGREVMAEVLSGKAVEYTLGLLLVLGIAKMLLSALSLGGGFVGGVFAPTLYVGTMLGGAFGSIVAAIAPASLVGGPTAYAIAGMAAMMAGVVRAPITGILLVFELTNDYRLILPIMLTTVLCVYITERMVEAGVDILFLLKSGLRLTPGREVDLMQGVTVQEAMQTPAPTIPESAALADLRDALRQQRTRSLCVVNTNGALVGIVTLADLQRAYEGGGDAPKTVADICTREVVVAAPDDVLWSVIRLMGARDIGRLPVVDHGALVGMIGRGDLVKAYNAAIAAKLAGQHHAEQVRLNTLTGAHVIELHVREGSPADGRTIRALGWPAESVVTSVRRGSKLIVPHGDTALMAGDVVTLVAAPETEPELRKLLNPT
jgi:CIC family chloride channel protein